jgi:hypothetical protein
MSDCVKSGTLKRYVVQHGARLDLSHIRRHSQATAKRKYLGLGQLECHPSSRGQSGCLKPETLKRYVVQHGARLDLSHIRRHSQATAKRKYLGLGQLECHPPSRGRSGCLKPGTLKRYVVQHGAWLDLLSHIRSHSQSIKLT